jgi:hypothetical protein
MLTKKWRQILPSAIESEVTDEESYSHFKNLLDNSKNLCKGKTKKGKQYKVHTSRYKDYATLLKNKHYKIIYIHNNEKIFAHAIVQLFYKDGNYMFIHKMCSSMPGLGSYLMKKIIKHAQQNASKLDITYLSLTTHNLDLIDFYGKFKPTFIHKVNKPGTKKETPDKVAYIIWKLSDKMPIYKYE